ncbi:hypothetical protein [Paenibacillus campi]|uniref:hypothetical protein n=1 Tax=Paenibacillus campi TaxID=3106031 RepID=UPI002AFF250B|nr:hypothetical protein [Paenibacillus sp. SGZ-1014]
MFNIPNYRPNWYTTTVEVWQDAQLIQQLQSLQHQIISEGIVMWDIYYDEHRTGAPFLLQLTDHQLEIYCYKLEHMAITLDRIDRTLPLEILDLEELGTFTYEWRNYASFTEQFKGAKMTSLWIEEYGFKTVVIDNKEFPEENGTMHFAWLLNGVYIATDKGDFSVYNGLDETYILFGDGLEYERLHDPNPVRRTLVFGAD